MTISLPRIRSFRGIFALLAMLLVTSCGDFGGGAEDRDPNMKRARERRAVGDFTGALEAYQKALDKRPGVARIHWDMATVYDQHLTNELRAIYHYERYLELDPKAERRKLVEQSIGLAKLSYAVSLPDQTSESVQEIARLRREIDSLRKLLTESREKIAELTAPPPVAIISPFSFAAPRTACASSSLKRFSPYCENISGTLMPADSSTSESVSTAFRPVSFESSSATVVLPHPGIPTRTIF